jgi:flagellar biosynthetic protein FliR
MNDSLDAISPYVTHVLLVAFRVIGIFGFAPLVSSSTIPVKVRLFIAGCFTLAIAPAVPVTNVPMESIFSLALAVAAEVVMGICIGLLAAVPLWVMQLSGLLMSMQIGLGMAPVFNPAMDTETDVFGELMLYLAIAVFLAIGGLNMVFLALAASFQHVPLGGFSLTDAPLDLLIGMIKSGFELSMRIAAPVIGILMVETVASGVIMKSIPQVNIMTVGFAVKIVLGIGALALSLAVVQDALTDELNHASNLLLHWAGAF